MAIPPQFRAIVISKVRQVSAYSTHVYDELKTLNRQYLSYISMRIHSKQTLANLSVLPLRIATLAYLLITNGLDAIKIANFDIDYWHHLVDYSLQII